MIQIKGQLLVPVQGSCDVGFFIALEEAGDRAIEPIRELYYPSFVLSRIRAAVYEGIQLVELTDEMFGFGDLFRAQTRISRLRVRGQRQKEQESKQGNQ